jgi:hypothetical protein
VPADIGELMTNPIIFTRAEDILRGRTWPQQFERPLRTLILLLALLILFGCFYGALMGTFAGVMGDRMLQVIYSAAKVPLLLIVTFLIALPSFFVLNTLLGVRSDFPAVFRALLTTQAGLTIILASLAPFTLFWYASVANYQAAILFNTLMFAVASVSAQFLLYRYYRPLIAGNALHRTLFRVWLILYAFVGIQMGWVLRPFVGDPSKPVQFFRQGAWGNAYEELVRIVMRLFHG